MRPDTHLTRRHLLRWSSAGVLACAGLSVALPACDTDGNFTLLGYTTQPNYDPKYKTIRVPIFQNRTFRRGLEFDLTEAVVREIEAKTPMKVRTAGQPADLELCGTIFVVTKNILNVNQLNEVREGEMVITVELVLRDLHTGEVLSRAGRRPTDAPPFEPLVPPAVGVNVPGVREAVVTGPPAAPGTPAATLQPPAADPIALGQPRPADPPPPPGPPLRASTSATFVPELGQSTTSAYQAAINKLAVQIVSMMEKPW
jgi:hypothetical protein